MKIIVSNKQFAEFLSVQLNNCTTYFMWLDAEKKQLHIKTDQDDQDDPGEYIWIESFRDPESNYIEFTGDQLKKLKGFLKAIPHQPILIELKPDEKIKCTQFTAEF
ncbi:hypothetical protein GCM10023149_48860 [Mucilaginibacter gynuensis]|uniref:Uncharacterized protein n=1 Tax=Mucilaginibacter gynuensis TaxID=1302236 RepID=A0ABP8HFL5_9SPHI